MNAPAPVNPFYVARRAKHDHRSLYLPTQPRFAKLPRAPLNASPAPRLPSLSHFDEAGPYGDRSYPGNCSGELIKDLLQYFEPGSVLDPLTGSGTCRDVCRELGTYCWSGDLRHGQDACDPAA